MKKRHIKISIICIAISLALPACSNSHTENEASHAGAEQLDEEHDEHEHDHAGLIKLDDHRAQEFGVKTENIEPTEFHEVITVAGQIESKASDESVATATRSGILTLSPNINQGVRVSAGSSIGAVRASNVQGADPTVEAIAARDAAKRELDRLAPLHKEGVVSTQKYNEALSAYEQAEASLRNSKQGSASISVPKAGVITQLLVKTGDYVEAGQRVAVISGNTNLTLRADVPEKYALQLSGIESANFRPGSSPETYSLKDLNGKLMTSNGSGIAENGYIPLYFSFDNNGMIAPGAFAEIFLVAGERPKVISVPKEAIVEINGNKCVYSLHGEGLYEKHVVKTGASDGQRVEIISGLESGEDVVVNGAQIVRMAETSATAVPGHTHNH